MKFNYRILTTADQQLGPDAGQILERAYVELIPFSAFKTTNSIDSKPWWALTLWAKFLKSQFSDSCKRCTMKLSLITWGGDAVSGKEKISNPLICAWVRLKIERSSLIKYDVYLWWWYGPGLAIDLVKALSESEHECCNSNPKCYPSTIRTWLASVVMSRVILKKPAMLHSAVYKQVNLWILYLCAYHV